MVAKGDTAYAIINVCNVREHVLGIQAATEIISDYPSWSEPEFWNRFSVDAIWTMIESPKTDWLCVSRLFALF